MFRIRMIVEFWMCSWFVMDMFCCFGWKCFLNLKIEREETFSNWFSLKSYGNECSWDHLTSDSIWNSSKTKQNSSNFVFLLVSMKVYAVDVSSSWFIWLFASSLMSVSDVEFFSLSSPCDVCRGRVAPTLIPPTRTRKRVFLSICFLSSYSLVVDRLSNQLKRRDQTSKRTQRK